jgi:outer membrane immunogenic protein
MYRFCTRLIVAISALALAPMATAADLPLKAPAYQPPPPPVFSWTGWYAGLNAGYNWGDGSVSSTAVPTGGLVPGVATGLALVGIYDLDPGHNGFIGGGQVGYNSQFNNLVTGIEADIQGLANNGRANRPFTGPVPGFSEQYFGTQSAQAEIRWLGTLRGRLGGLISPSALIYVTGGLAYGGVNAGGAINAQENASLVAKPFDFLPSVGGAINSQTRAGWTLGGGWEWMLAPRWSVKAEYLYYDLGTVSTNYGVSTLCTPVACAMPSMPIYGTAAVYTSTRLNGNIARAGVNYRF